MPLSLRTFSQMGQGLAIPGRPFLLHLMTKAVAPFRSFRPALTTARTSAWTVFTVPIIGWLRLSLYPKDRTLPLRTMAQTTLCCLCLHLDMFFSAMARTRLASMHFSPYTINNGGGKMRVPELQLDERQCFVFFKSQSNVKRHVGYVFIHGAEVAVERVVFNCFDFRFLWHSVLSPGHLL